MRITAKARIIVCYYVAMLKSIQLWGFKSFAKKGELVFDSSITAIVGPNGSGKSNIAEAFRFVLGEQGTKSMRVKKGTDLIWGGSHTLPKSSRAGVKVVLDNSQNQLKLDFSEVIIERSVLRDGTNEYSINGSRVRLKDIQDLLAGANIGSSGHHIISQGQADRILGASPKERKEILEDALGLKTYYIKKAEANRRLEATKMNLEKAESRRRELLPHLKFLARQVARVEQAQKIKQELKEKSKIYFTKEKEWIENETKALQIEIPKPSEQIQIVEQRIKKLKDKIKHAKILNQNSNEHSEQLQNIKNQKDKLINLRSTLATLRTELGKVRGQIDMLNTVAQKVKTLPNSISRKEVRDFLIQIAQVLKMGDVKKAQRLVEDFIHTKLLQEQPKENKYTDLEQERTLLIKSQRELQEQISGQEQAIRSQEAIITELQENLKSAEQRETEYERDLYKASAEYNELKTILNELGRRKENLMARRQSLHENMREVQVLIGEDIFGGSVSKDAENVIGSFTDINGKTDISLMPTRKDIERLKIQLEQYGTLSTEVLQEYKEAQEHNDFLNKEIEDLKNASQTLKNMIADLHTRMHKQFTHGLNLINREFDNFFSVLFGGGTASIELQELHQQKDDSQDVRETYKNTEKQYGVNVKVHLPRKKITTLDTLSGGERALASIALIFAMSQVNPPPFIILDETDAALDEANSQRYANIVKQLAKRSQIILITHNRATMATADNLYGVTMSNDGVSQLLSVKFTEAEQFAK